MSNAEMMGFELLSSGRYERAACALARAIREGTTYASTFWRLGQAYEGAGEQDLAYAAYAEAQRRAHASSTEIIQSTQVAMRRLASRRASAERITLDQLTAPREEREIVQHGFSFSRLEFVSLTDRARAATSRGAGVADYGRASEAAFHRGDTKLAIEILEAAVNSCSVFATKRRLLRFAARLWFSMGDVDRARVYAGLATFDPGSPLGPNGCHKAVQEADAMLAEGQPERAVALLERAVEEMMATEDPLGLKGLGMLCRARLKAEQVEPAIADARRIVEFGVAVKHPLIEATGHAMEGKALALTPKKGLAAASFKKALDLLEHCDEPCEIAKVLVDLASVQVDLRAYDDARASLDEAERIFAASSDENGLASVCMSRGAYLTATGGDARAAYEHAEALYLRAGNIAGACLAISALGDRLMDTGHVVESLGHLHRMQVLLRRSGDELGALVPSKEQLGREGIGAIRTFLGTLVGEGVEEGYALLVKSSLSLFGDHETALQILDSANEIFARAGLLKGQLRVAMERSKVLLRAGRPDEAAGALGDAEFLATQVGDEAALADVHVEQGRLKLEIGDPEGAIALLRTAVDTLARLPSVNPVRLSRALGELSVARVTARQFDAAMVDYERAWSSLDAERARASFIELERRMAKAWLMHGRAEAALVHARRGHGRMVAFLRGQDASSLTADLVEGSADIMATLIESYRSLGRIGEAVHVLEQFRSPTLSLAAGLPLEESSLESLHAEYDRVTADGSVLLSWHIPERAGRVGCVVARRGAEPLFLDTNTPHEALLDLVEPLALADERQADVNASLLGKIHRLLFCTKARAFTFDGRMIDAASTVEEHVFASPSATLKVIPQGLLHLVPFAALTRTLHGRPRYLVEDRPVLVAPKLQMLDKPLLRRSAKRRALVIGNPDASLPHSEREAERVAGLLRRQGFDVVLRGQGSPVEEEEIRRCSDFDILHFATHGAFDPLASFDAHIKLGPRQRYRLSRILADALRCETVVLSACKTAMVDFRRLHEVVSLSSAFLSAGAGRVLGALWAVHDASTALLLERIYEDVLACGSTWVDALRRAQLAMIHGGSADLAGKDFSSPYHWAALQCYGTG